MRLALLLVTGCVFSGDVGVLQRDPLDVKGASGTVHMELGGGGMSGTRYLIAASLDSRFDLASGASRWALGPSVLGGIRTGPLYIDARAGAWNSVFSSVSDQGWVPSLELGGYVPTAEHFDPKHPQFGESNEGVVFGLREDFIPDVGNYFTVFIGYALFIVPGY